MPTMTATAMIDIDQLCANMNEQQLGLLAAKALRRMTENFGTSLPFTLCDENHAPLATISPFEVLMSSEEENSEFVREFQKRMSDPNQKLLSADEFLAAITRK